MGRPVKGIQKKSPIKRTSPRLAFLRALKEAELSSLRSRAFNNLLQSLQTSESSPSFEIRTLTCEADPRNWIEITRRNCDITPDSGGPSKALAILFCDSGILRIRALGQKLKPDKIIEDPSEWLHYVEAAVHMLDSSWTFCEAVRPDAFEATTCNLSCLPDSIIECRYPFLSYRSVRCELWFKKVSSRHENASLFLP